MESEEWRVEREQRREGECSTAPAFIIHHSSLIPHPSSFSSLLDGQADDEPFEDQSRWHSAIALEVLIGFQQPAVELRPALAAQLAKLLLGLLQDKRFDAGLPRAHRGGSCGDRRPRPGGSAAWPWRNAAARRKSAPTAPPAARRSQQAIELPHGFADLAVQRGVEHVPGGFRSPAARRLARPFPA